ncbi:DNA endonuclease [Anoxybacillus kestanbolensis]|uniref:DNA endonuclease n=2 Tax=Anoxybacillus kestanbolensis TaxID=227476 RepID=A0A1V3FPS0_9BACL|nr:DNA endonuclease [Anoxybacillus kestanbolensis]
MYLTPIQQNILIASIIGDGEITKIYPNSRRKNHSYREHFGLDQQAYRKWKISFFDGLLYISEKSNCVRSASLPLFTTLYPHFYDKKGIKHIPIHLLRYCTLPYFLAVLYMDDGSLCISTTVNARKKLIYLTPHIYLYLQCYPPKELEQLQNHILKFFNVIFRLSKRKDGQGMILKTTSVKDTFLFLDLVSPITFDCPSMYYKTNWNERLQMEKEKWKRQQPDFNIVVSSADRWKNYTDEEIQLIKKMKKNGATIQEIADALQRSYWSVMYKWREINKRP